MNLQAIETANAIQPGWDVIGSDDERIGTVEEATPAYVLVRKGMLFPKDIYIPLSAVTRVEPVERYVYINVPKGRIDSLDWTEPPAGAATPASDTVAQGGALEMPPPRDRGVGDVGVDDRDKGLTATGDDLRTQPPPGGETDPAARSDLLEGRTTAEHNAASTGWEGASEVVEDDFEREELRRKKLEGQVQPPPNLNR